MSTGGKVPLTFKIDAEADLERCFAALATRPVWVRGSGVPGVGVGVASLPCRELRHAVAWVDHWQGWGRFIASEYLPGRSEEQVRGSLFRLLSRAQLDHAEAAMVNGMLAQVRWALEHPEEARAAREQE